MRLYNNIMFLFQDIDGAKDYFKRKVTFIEEQIDKVMQLSMEKSKLSRGIYVFFSLQSLYGTEDDIYSYNDISLCTYFTTSTVSLSRI